LFKSQSGVFHLELQCWCLGILISYRKPIQRIS